MAGAISEQYRDELQKKVKDQITEYMDAKNIVGNMFGGETISDNIIQKIIFQHFDKIAEANLSGRLWDPAKSKLVASNYSHWRYSCGSESRMAYEDWGVLDKQNILSVGLERLGEKPMKQLTHYFFTGEQLLDNGTRARSPISDQYNYCLDPGTGNGTLERPLQLVETGNAWSSAANVRADVEAAINGYLAINPDAVIANLKVFYPAVARTTVFKKFSTSGDGLFSGASIFQELGVKENNIVGLAPVYLPTGPNGTLIAPTTANFDIYIIDPDQVKVWYTEAPATNVYFEKMQSMHPEMVIESNVAALPVFYPIVGENTSSKIYKGVTVINGIST